MNGELHCKEAGVEHRADLITMQEYGDFELAIDWKVDKGANSGIIWHASEQYAASYESGPEYQLIDDNGYKEKLEDWQKSGSEYAMYPPSTIATRPAGEYNHSVLQVKQAHVIYWLNSVKVVEYDLWTND